MKTYDQLKDLPAEKLILKIMETLVMGGEAGTLPAFQSDPPGGLPPPTLCLIGDFEIRARFYK